MGNVVMTAFIKFIAFMIIEMLPVASVVHYILKAMY